MSADPDSYISGDRRADFGGRRSSMGPEDFAFIAKQHYRGLGAASISRMLNRPFPDVQAFMRQLDDPQVTAVLLEEVRALRVDLARQPYTPPPPPPEPPAPIQPILITADAEHMALRTMADVTIEVANYYGVTLEQIIGQSRCASIVRARQAAFYAIRQIKWQNGTHRYSTPQVGRYFDDRHHTTVLHGVAEHSRRLADAARVAG